MKAWEMKKNTNYEHETGIYKIDTYTGNLLKATDNELTEFIECNVSYNHLKGMDFEEYTDPKCNHRDINGNLTLDYDNSYEMRSREMHCSQCGKSGTKDELSGIDSKGYKIIGKVKYQAKWN